jgi:hypothetical protein
LIVATFKESQHVYKDGENKWKLSVFIVLLNLICPTGKSMIRLVQSFIDAAKSDEDKGHRSLLKTTGLLILKFILQNNLFVFLYPEKAI